MRDADPFRHRLRGRRIVPGQHRHSDTQRAQTSDRRPRTGAQRVRHGEPRGEAAVHGEPEDRALLRLPTDEDRLRALRAARALLVPGGRFVFDIFEPSDEDVETTHARWIEREPGIFERADWDVESRTLTLSLRSGDEATTMALAWLSPPEWRALLERAGFRVEAHYGWFDRRPWDGGEDSVWVAVR